MGETDKLYNNIDSKVSISPADFQELEAYFKLLTIKKKNTLLKEGEYNDRLFFVEKGLLYLYKTLQSGDIQVIQFAREDYWLSDLCSFFSGSRALFSIQALEDSTVYTLSKGDFDMICVEYPGMETFFRLNFQSAYVNTLVRLSDAYSQDTETKYTRIRQENAALLQRVPQYLIASYLGVLPSSLSRIRNKN
jgi:CRP-like cAMP-binding protein